MFLLCCNLSLVKIKVLVQKLTQVELVLKINRTSSGNERCVLKRNKTEIKVVSRASVKLVAMLICESTKCERDRGKAVSMCL